MKKKRLFISLSPAAFSVLQELANSKGLTKSLVIEQYLQRNLRQRRKNEVYSGVEFAGGSNIEGSAKKRVEEL